MIFSNSFNREIPDFSVRNALVLGLGSGQAKERKHEEFP
jgi:hypothetical protein